MMKCANPECNKEFEPKVAYQKYCCGQCQKRCEYIRAKARQGKRPKKAKVKRPPTPKEGKSLSEWVREANDCNLDYGSFRAMIKMGKTYAELKATANMRQVQVHSHISMRRQT